MNPVIITGITSIKPKEIISSRIKADELFLTWLAQKETKDFMKELIEDEINKNKESIKRHKSAIRRHSVDVLSLSRKNQIVSKSGSNVIKTSVSGKHIPVSPRSRSKDSEKEVKKKSRSKSIVESEPKKSPRKKLILQTKNVRTFRLSRIRSPDEIEAELSLLQTTFELHKEKELDLNGLISSVLDIFQLPKYLHSSLKAKVSAFQSEPNSIQYEEFMSFWTPEIQKSDRTTKIYHILKKTENRYIAPDDWVLFLKYLLENHPGFEFIKDSPEFQDVYIETVIARIYFNISRSYRRRISLSDLKASNLVESLYQLQQSEDITSQPKYFDYLSHFVIYKSFLELSSSKDLSLTFEQLSSYNSYSITNRVAERAFYYIRFSDDTSYKKYLYKDFVWFMMAEEDKTLRKSIELWFRCLDYDEDGYLSPNDLFYFYEEQLFRMEYTLLDVIPFEYVYSQIIDMVKPKDPSRITLNEFRNCGYVSEIFNLIFNLNKYLEDEKRVPKLNYSVDNDLTETDWDAYASSQYELALGEVYFDDSDDSDIIDLWPKIETEEYNSSALSTPRSVTSE